MTFLSSLGVEVASIRCLAEAVREMDTFQLGQAIAVDPDLKLEGVCQALAAAKPPRGSLELTTRERREVPPDKYLTDGTDLVEPLALENALMGGATLMVTDIAAWGEELNAAACPRDAYCLEVNLFVSGPLCQAYPAHFDLLDAVIVQLVGSKGWQLWSTLAEDTRRRATKEIAQLDPPTKSAILNPGDVLLMPSHTPHLVSSTFVPSVHVAVAVRETEAR